MRYSFITPRKKHFFSMFTKVWLVFIFSVVILLNMFNLFIIYKNFDFKKSTNELNQNRILLEKDIEKIDEQTGFILRQKAVAEEIYANNLVLKDSMKNLFDLVPDQITLQRVIMEKNSLIIYGSTPTKDAFNFLLAAPLKSIFHTSQTIFYLTKGGWYNFVSTNKIIDPEGIE